MNHDSYTVNKDKRHYTYQMSSVLKAQMNSDNLLILGATIMHAVISGRLTPNLSLSAKRNEAQRRTKVTQ